MAVLLCCEIVAPSPLAKKLLIKPGHNVALINAPDGYKEKLEPLPENAAVAATRGSADVCLVFTGSIAEVDQQVAAAQLSLKPGGILWVCFKKGGAKAGTDLNRDVLWEHLGRSGLTGVTLVAVDETWSAMRARS